MAYVKRSAAVNAVQEISIVECLLIYSCSATATYVLQRWNRTRQTDSDFVWKHWRGVMTGSTASGLHPKEHTTSGFVLQKWFFSSSCLYIMEKGMAKVVPDLRVALVR